MIGNYAFKNIELEEIIIPSPVKKIGNGSFNHCSSLKHVTINSSIIRIEKDTFYFCTSLITNKYSFYS